MRRILFFSIPVIVLVCLSWFAQVKAQSIELPDHEIDNARAHKLLLSSANNQPIDKYRSPQIYSQQMNPLVSQPPDSLTRSTVPDSTDPADTASGAMVPFSSLQPFGIELFVSSLGRLPPNDIATAGDYVLGPGDNLLVYLWGNVEKEYDLTIDREGRVFVPRVGGIVVYGMTIDDCEILLRKKLSEVYTGFDLSVSLGNTRSIRVYLTGEVRHPGAYTVSSLTSLFNALYLAGGPNARGSMRDIHLMRNGKQIAKVDLYKFLLAGDNGADVRLQSGDAIFVPVAGIRAAIRGEVNRPAIYELTGDETVAGLLELAGRPTATAYLKRILLERVRDRNEWEVVDINLDPEPPQTVHDTEVADGDQITVYSIFDFKENMVAVYGQVRHPGYYERTDSLRVADLVQMSTLQPYNVHYDRANIFRPRSDGLIEVISVNLQAALDGDPVENVVIEDRDSLYIYSVDEVERDKFVYIDGEVRNPGKYDLYYGMTASDLIFLAGSYTKGASRLQAEIARVDSLGKVHSEFVALTNDEADRTLLTEDDRVYIRPIPQWRLHRAVKLEGEVNYPGEYTLRSDAETLFDLLTRAGGFSDHAFPTGAVFERSSINESLKRRHINQVLERTSPLIEDSNGVVSTPLRIDYDTNSVNRLVIDLERIMTTQGDEGNVVLQPGDRIFIPPVPSGISVLGAVGSQGTIGHRQGKKVKDYIKLAGGFTEQADKGATRLIRADGTVYANSGTMGKKVQVGDVIVVPTKIDKPGNFGKTLTTVLSTTTGVLTSVLLISKL